MKLTLYFEDYYDWDPSKAVTLMGIKLPLHELATLYEVGLANNFYMKGKVYYNIEWKTGERMGSGAKVQEIKK